MNVRDQIEEEVYLLHDCESRYLRNLIAASGLFGCAAGVLLHLVTGDIIHNLSDRLWVLLSFAFCLVGLIFSDRAIRMRMMVRQRTRNIAALLTMALSTPLYTPGQVSYAPPETPSHYLN